MKLLTIILLLAITGCASERIVIIQAKAGGLWGAIRGNVETIDIAREGMKDTEIDIVAESGKPMIVKVKTPKGE